MRGRFILNSLFIGVGLSLKNILVIITLIVSNSSDVASLIVLASAAIIGAFLRFVILYLISIALILVILYILTGTKLRPLTRYVIAFYPLAISGIINALLYSVKNIFELREIVMFGGWLFSYLLLAWLLLHTMKKRVPVFFSVVSTAIIVLYLFPPFP